MADGSARLEPGVAQALEDDAIARAARLRPPPGGRHWAVLVAVLRLTTGYRKAADWVTLAQIGRLAFGLERDAELTEAEWRDTRRALLWLNRHKVIASVAPRGRGGGRYWISPDLKRGRPTAPKRSEKGPSDGPDYDGKGTVGGQKRGRPLSETGPPDAPHSLEVSHEISQPSSSLLAHASRGVAHHAAGAEEEERRASSSSKHPSVDASVLWLKGGRPHGPQCSCADCFARRPEP